MDLLEARTFQKDATYKSEEVSQRQNLSKKLNRARHTVVWKHESGKENLRKKREEGHLKGLKLGLRNGRNKKAQRQRSRYEHERRPVDIDE